jgi:hypothetical protein
VVAGPLVTFQVPSELTSVIGSWKCQEPFETPSEKPGSPEPFWLTAVW